MDRLSRVKQFKKAFIEANMLDIIKKNYEVIMIWITGSTLSGLAEDYSDYDLAVLIADDVTTTRYVRNDDYLLYKPENRKVQWMYETVEDITTLQPNFKLRNIGWSIFRHITDDFIIYKNPKYLSFIETLINKRYEISKYSMYLYYNTKQDIIKPILTCNCIPEQSKVRSLHHLCWIYDTLNSRELDSELLLKLKHIMEVPVDEQTLETAFIKIKFLEEYFNSHRHEKPQLFFERKL